MNTAAPNSADRGRQNNNNNKKGNKVLFVSFSNNTCIYMYTQASLS